jgi:hypothetical protein
MVSLPSNNVYKAVSDGEIDTCQVCVRHTVVNTPAPLIRTLSMPITQNINELMSLLSSFYFVEQLLHHESGNIIVWVKLCETREEEGGHIGIIRLPDEQTTTITVTHADEIMLSGLFMNSMIITRIVRANTHHSSDFARETMYCAYIIYLEEGNEQQQPPQQPQQPLQQPSEILEEGEVPDATW